MSSSNATLVTSPVRRSSSTGLAQPRPRKSLRLPVKSVVLIRSLLLAHPAQLDPADLLPPPNLLASRLVTLQSSPSYSLRRRHLQHAASDHQTTGRCEYRLSRARLVVLRSKQ